MTRDQIQDLKSRILSQAADLQSTGSLQMLVFDLSSLVSEMDATIVRLEQGCAREVNDELSAPEKKSILTDVHDGKKSPEMTYSINAQRKQSGEKPVSFGAVDAIGSIVRDRLKSEEGQIEKIRPIQQYIEAK